MYYLWKDKIGAYYITDYKEIRKTDGFVLIDAVGYTQAELVFSHEVKNEVIAFAQKEAFK